MFMLSIKCESKFKYSRCSCAVMAKKCTKKHDARASCCFASLNLLLFRRSRFHRHSNILNSLSL